MLLQISPGVLRSLPGNGPTLDRILPVAHRSSRLRFALVQVLTAICRLQDVRAVHFHFFGGLLGRISMRLGSARSGKLSNPKTM